MSTTIYEFFGYRATDRSPTALLHQEQLRCPHLDEKCEKTLSDGEIAGVCTLKPARKGPVICCPIRLYADGYGVLRDIADVAFSPGLPMFPGREAVFKAKIRGESTIAVFGKRWSGELRLPQRRGVGSYFVDWILALVDSSGVVVEFVAVEVQSIDTTGNYRTGRASLLAGLGVAKDTAGFNWENVNKRIIPQLIYKGNVLQREKLCKSGLFFVTPMPVYSKIMERLGGEDALLEYPLQSSSLTFMAYDIDVPEIEADGEILPLRLDRYRTTNVGQVAQAFAGPGVMPPANCYTSAINAALSLS